MLPGTARPFLELSSRDHLAIQQFARRKKQPSMLQNCKAHSFASAGSPGSATESSLGKSGTRTSGRLHKPVSIFCPPGF